MLYFQYTSILSRGRRLLKVSPSSESSDSRPSVCRGDHRGPPLGFCRLLCEFLRAERGFQGHVILFGSFRK